MASRFSMCDYRRFLSLGTAFWTLLHKSGHTREIIRLGVWAGLNRCIYVGILILAHIHLFFKQPLVNSHFSLYV